MGGCFLPLGPITATKVFVLETHLMQRDGILQGCADKSVQLFPRSSGKAIAKDKEGNGMKV